MTLFERLQDWRRQTTKPVPLPALIQPDQPQPETPGETMSFLSKFEAEFKKLFGSAPAWVHIAQAVVTFAAPIAVTALTVADPALLPVATPIIAQVQTDLATVSVLAGDGTSTPSLSAAIARIQDNMTTLLSEAHVTDPKTVTNINLVVAEMKSLAALIPAPAATPAA